jgi:hypothetical protein
MATPRVGRVGRRTTDMTKGGGETRPADFVYGAAIEQVVQGREATAARQGNAYSKRPAVT